MKPFMPRAAAVLTLFAAALPASAAFLERHDHWTVFGLGATSCMAVNRPMEEFNAAPYAALALHQRRGQPARLQIFAWPGVFKEGDTVKVTVTIGGAWTDFEAQAAANYMVQSKDTVPSKMLSDLRGEQTADFDIPGVGQRLVFDLSQLDAVLKSLDACARQLKG